MKDYIDNVYQSYSKFKPVSTPKVLVFGIVRQGNNLIENFYEQDKETGILYQEKPNWLGGYRHHNISDQSTNNWIWALPSWGEAWHNNHHRYPKRWYFGDKWYEFDISGHIINLIRNDKT